MARIRTIKPEFWTSEQVVECSPIARLLFIGIWNFADDGGVIPSSLRGIKMKIFPGDEFSLDEVQRMVAELEENGLMFRYLAEGKEYLSVTGWHHQKIEKPTYRYPGPDKGTPTPPKGNGQIDKFDDHSTTIRRPFDDHSTTEGKESMYSRDNNPPKSPLREGETVPVADATDGEKPNRPKDSKTVSLPGWLFADLWEAFQEHRKKLRKPMTLQAEKLILGKLDRWRREGHDPNNILETSIVNGWQGIFEPRSNGNGTNQRNAQQVNSATGRAEAALERIRARQRRERERDITGIRLDGRADREILAADDGAVRPQVVEFIRRSG